MRKIAIIGTGSGIGKALTEVLSTQEDVEIIALSRSMPSAAVSQYIPFDVLTEQDPPPYEGELHGLVYCPGSIVLRPFHLLSLKDFRADMEINFFGAVRMLKHYQRALKLSGNASVILFSTVAAGTGMLYHASIASAKAAVEGLVRSLAAEMAPAVRVNAIAPSLVNTRLANRLVDSDAKIKVAGERHPMKRIGEAADVAHLANFLLSNDSSWITGQIFGVDGGLSAISL